MSVDQVSVRTLVESNDRQFRVDSRVYTSQEVFELEIQHIYEKTWLCLGHESQVRAPGQFFTFTMGRQPVVVVRGAHGDVNVFFNRCRHRGAVVCHETSGCQRSFRCMYHGWTYGTDGALLRVTMDNDRYPDGWPRPAGLVPVPRVQVFAGFIFATLNREACSLEEHLGNAKDYLEVYGGWGDKVVAPLDVTSGSTRIRYKGNWKQQMENTVDSYHPSYTHRSQGQIIQRRRGDQRTQWRERQAALKGWDLGNGHGVLEITADALNAPVSGKFFRGPAFHLTIFPNLALLQSQVRIIFPMAPGLTEVEVRPVMVEGMPEDEVVQRLQAFQEFYGPAGFGLPDDSEVFARVQLGVAASADIDELRWMDLSRGLAYEAVDDAGRRSDRFGDESAQRALYRRWASDLSDTVISRLP